MIDIINATDKELFLAKERAVRFLARIAKLFHEETKFTLVVRLARDKDEDYIILSDDVLNDVHRVIENHILSSPELGPNCNPSPPPKN